MFQKYAAAIITIAITILTAIAALPSNVITAEVGVQLAILGLGGVGTYFLPLLNGSWAGGLKTGLNILTAIGTAVLPVINFVEDGTINTTQVIIVVVAVLNAVLVEVGVNVRTDQAVRTVARHRASDEPIQPSDELDAPAVRRELRV